MKIKSILAVTALFTFAIMMAACGAPATNTTVNVNAKPADTKPAATPATTAPATTSTAPKADDKKDEVAAGDSVGVPECDDYIKKYEACLTSVAAKAPQVAPALKTAFEQQRDGFKKAASTPAGKAGLAATCKQMVDTAKTSMSAYSCTW